MDEIGRISVAVHLSLSADYADFRRNKSLSVFSVTLYVGIISRSVLGKATEITEITENTEMG